LAAAYNLNQTPTFTGYLVTTEGTITLPVLGKIQVQNLTLGELENFLTTKLKDDKHLTNPIVTVRLMNAKFTVLGEVNKPGTYTFNEENISVLQALGYAGDLTINGVRNDILIIREENNVKTYAKIDLTSKDWFNSPYYYIKPNDVVYVNPNGAKVKSAGYIGSLGNFLTIVSIGVSTVLTILVLSK
jgi:polysaccharide export outer membrane protein